MKIEIDISDAEIEYLKQYASVYEKERKIDCTADPIVLVQDRYKEYICGDYCNDGYDYELVIGDYSLTEDELLATEEELNETLEETLNEYNLSDETIEEIKDDIESEMTGFYSDDEFEEEYENIKIYIKKHYFKYKYKTVAYFLTRAEAEKYLKYQAHNLNNPRIFTDYAGYHNYGDYPTLSKMLLEIGRKLIEEVQE